MRTAVRVLLAFSCLAALVGAFLPTAVATSQLEATFPALEQLGLRTASFDKTCPLLEYARGSFGSGCNEFLWRSEFDDQARSDLAALGKTLDAHGVFGINYIHVGLTGDGKLGAGTIFRTGSCVTYEYAPTHDYVPKRVGSDTTVSEIDANWFLLRRCGI